MCPVLPLCHHPMSPTWKTNPLEEVFALDEVCIGADQFLEPSGDEVCIGGDQVHELHHVGVGAVGETESLIDFPDGAGTPGSHGRSIRMRTVPVA